MRNGEQLLRQEYETIVIWIAKVDMVLSAVEVEKYTVLASSQPQGAAEGVAE